MNCHFPLIVPGTEQFRDVFDLTRDYEGLESTFHGTVATRGDFHEALEDAHVFAVEQEDEIVGFAWLNRFTGRAAASHVCLWPTATDRVELGKEFLKAIFALRGAGPADQYWLDALIGMVPDSYTHASKYAQAIGLRRTGLIPHGVTVGGRTEDLHLFAITREDI